MTYTPITSKWPYGSIPFKIARLMLKRTTLTQGLTLDEISSMVFEKKADELTYEDRKTIRKGLLKIRQDDPKGVVLLVYADSIANQLTKRGEWKFYNRTDKEAIDPVKDRMQKIIEGLIARKERIEEIVSEPWENREKKIQQALEDHADKVKEQQDKLIVGSMEVKPVIVAGVDTSGVKVDKFNIWRCHKCGQGFLPEKMPEHVSWHAHQEADLYAKTMIDKFKAKEKRDSENFVKYMSKDKRFDAVKVKKKHAKT